MSNSTPVSPTGEHPALTPDESALLTLAGQWSGVYLPASDPRVFLAAGLEARGLVTLDRTDPAQICVSLTTPRPPAPQPHLTLLPPRAPAVPPTRPLTPDEQGLLEFAETLADQMESGAVVFLTEPEVRFMTRVAGVSALAVPLWLGAAVAIAERLEASGLVTIDHRTLAGHILVSAVRPTDE